MKKLPVDELLGALLLGIMSLITFINVINRYFFKSSIAFTEEITVHMFVWITLLGISIAFRKGSNLRMTNVFDTLSVKMKKAALLGSGLLGIGLFLFLITNSVQEIYKNMTFYKTTSEALGIPTWIYSLGTPIFSTVVIIEIVKSTRKALRKTTQKEGN
ncbi:MAG: TRAP transporter small permease subunit [Spirochaetales bacterium]